MTLVSPAGLCQVEIAVSDMDTALRFYREAFGWQRSPAELHDYVVLEVPEHCPFGIALVPRRSRPASDGSPNLETRSAIVIYFKDQDPEATCTRVVAAGGKKKAGPIRLPGYGSIYLVADPEGTVFGLLGNN